MMETIEYEKKIIEIKMVILQDSTVYDLIELTINQF